MKSNYELYKGKSEGEILSRISELEKEWDTERVLETNFAIIVLIASILGLKNKKWAFLSGITSIFMIQHAIQGWCPPLPIIRRLGVRTSSEIFQEKAMLSKLLKEM
jgi:hypothetical protein